MTILYGRNLCKIIARPFRAMATNPQIKFLDMPNGNKIAFEKVEGSVNLPTVIFVPGFMSGKDGDKPTHLREYCTKKNYTYIRYDPTCIGESVGDWKTLEFQDWVENAGSILENSGSDNNIVIGSSMGGWISLWLASQERYKQKIQSLILIAPALNVLRHFYAETVKKLPQEAKDILDRGEIYQIKDEYGVKPLKKSFAENSASFEIDLDKAISVSCPVKILHGVADDTVPYKNSVRIMESLETENVEVMFRKEAGHRFVEEESLKMIESSLEKVIHKK